MRTGGEEGKLEEVSDGESFFLFFHNANRKLFFKELTNHSHGFSCKCELFHSNCCVCTIQEENFDAVQQ